MDQNERIDRLLAFLIAETGQEIKLPEDLQQKKALLRALMNMRLPAPIPEEILRIQDQILQEETAAKGVVESSALPRAALDSRLSVWRGDITRLRVDAIVNAANDRMLGCFVPGHHCIDNAIHSAAGLQLREFMNEAMVAQGHSEPTGMAKISPGYNLPAKYILHTVGPIVSGELTEAHKKLLASSYVQCLSLAAEHELKSIAFCSISTGVFGFPKEPAAHIAVDAVREFFQNKSSIQHVIFNVFSDADEMLYRSLLDRDNG